MEVHAAARVVGDDLKRVTHRQAGLDGADIDVAVLLVERVQDAPGHLDDLAVVAVVVASDVSVFEPASITIWSGN